MASHMMADVKKSSLQGMRCGLSGSGRVARATALKLIEMGAKVVAVSDPEG
jgi:glutamate dehydrogenase/leucine dehydrogenase